MSKALPFIAWAILVFVMLSAAGAMLLSDWHKAQSVRAAIGGNCALARAEALKAGSIPYDATRFCPELEGRR